ncbi:MAG: DUF1801 domain-containing protein [Bacteroidia bacterium]
MNNLNEDVTNFLDELKHPLRTEIELLRHYILNAENTLTENIKWNSPNYCFENEDRITMRIQPITMNKIQVVFHCGSKVKELPSENLIEDKEGILIWKSTDRAIATYKSAEEIENGKIYLVEIIIKWLNATRQ